MSTLGIDVTRRIDQVEAKARRRAGRTIANMWASERPLTPRQARRVRQTVRRAGLNVTI